MSYTVVENSPVIYCGGVGGGPNEFVASVGTPSTHIIDMPVPSGGRIKEAWYAPFDNIADLTKFAQIDVNRHNDRQVKLSCSSYSGAVSLGGCECVNTTKKAALELRSLESIMCCCWG